MVVFGVLGDETLEDKCLSPMLEAADLDIEYCRVESDRRVFIGVDARQSGRCGRWPSCNLLDVSCPNIVPLPLTVVAILPAAMLSALVLVDRERDNLWRRMFLRGEREDWRDCHTSGTTAAGIDCDGLVSTLRMTGDILHLTGKPERAVCRSIANVGGTRPQSESWGARQSRRALEWNQIKHPCAI